MKEHYSLGEYRPTVEQALAGAEAGSYAARIWAKDPTLWKEDPEHQKIIGNSLGWLTVADSMLERVADLEEFARKVRADGFTSVFLLGMGGSSLAPEVAASTFGARPGYPRLTVLDTTDPDTILKAERGTDLARTLFLVSSKSGGTIESASLEKYFHARVAATVARPAGRSFVAITDPGTSLARLAAELGYLRVFENPKDIGGRYSALSYFGLVPMALLGIDTGEILGRAVAMERRCGSTVAARENPGLVLGATLGALARAGRDKVTFVLAPEIGALGYWLEQLIAESTGKEGVGIVPVEGEPLGDPSEYGDDRVFVALSVAGTKSPPPAERLEALGAAGHPVLAWELGDRADLGAEFFRWEFATAVAGAVLGIDPFDQPNVQESKDNTARLIQAFRATGRHDEGEPIWSDGAFALYGSRLLYERLDPGSLARLVGSYLGMTHRSDYFAALAYVGRSEHSAAALARLRRAVRSKFRVATTVGFGPRFLHSTGQLHKGGVNNGVFLQITSDAREDLPIPDEPYSFETLRRAQALGDLESLQAHGRRVLRLHLGKDAETALTQLGAALI